MSICATHVECWNTGIMVKNLCNLVNRDCFQQDEIESQYSIIPPFHYSPANWRDARSELSSDIWYFVFLSYNILKICFHKNPFKLLQKLLDNALGFLYFQALNSSGEEGFFCSTLLYFSQLNSNRSSILGCKGIR